jgi:6-phosphogluconate dehydrogenase (decarboxylating)
VAMLIEGCLAIRFGAGRRKVRILHSRVIGRSSARMIAAAIGELNAAHILSATVCPRFISKGQHDCADKVLSMLRYQFNGHAGKVAAKNGSLE